MNNLYKNYDKHKFQDCALNQKMAEQLLIGELDIDELTEEEVDEMLIYFYNDISKQNAELKRIKENIVQMKKSL